MKPVIHRKVRTRITEDFSLRLDGKQLIEMINTQVRQSGPHAEVPLDATVYVRVPGGADWSNTDLDIDEHFVCIDWTVESGDDA